MRSGTQLGSHQYLLMGQTCAAQQEFKKTQILFLQSHWPYFRRSTVTVASGYFLNTRDDRTFPSQQEGWGSTV